MTGEPGSTDGSYFGTRTALPHPEHLTFLPASLRPPLEGLAASGAREGNGRSRSSSLGRSVGNACAPRRLLGPDLRIARDTPRPIAQATTKANPRRAAAGQRVDTALVSLLRRQRGSEAASPTSRPERIVSSTSRASTAFPGLPLSQTLKWHARQVFRGEVATEDFAEFVPVAVGGQKLQYRSFAHQGATVRLAPRWASTGTSSLWEALWSSIRLAYTLPSLGTRKRAILANVSRASLVAALKQIPTP